MTVSRAPLKVRVKTGKKRSVSSKRWLERQLNDPYVARAKREGMRSRAAYKLIEIDDRHRILKAGARVVDLGAAPGGWSEIAAKRVGAKGRVVAIDLLEMVSLPGVDFLQLDFLDVNFTLVVLFEHALSNSHISSTSQLKVQQNNRARKAPTDWRSAIIAFENIR